MGSGTVILLDTHVLVWWVDGSDRLSSAQADAIERAREMREPVAVSAITFWEISMLVSNGRLVIGGGLESWQGLVRLAGVQVLPVDGEIAVKSVLLPQWDHKDPADRFIVATALHHNATLLSSDARIGDYMKRSGGAPVID